MKVCVVSPALEETKARLQPACYILKLCQHLAELGLDVAMVSDGYPRLPQLDNLDGLKVHRFRQVRFPLLLGNRALQRFVEHADPDVLLWHMGLTSFYHLRLRGKISKPVIGIFTSPVYTLGDIVQLGPVDLVRDFTSIYGHLLGTAVPRALVRSFTASEPFRAMIVQSGKTKEGLVRLAISPDKLHVVPPAVDREWLAFSQTDDAAAQVRSDLGFDDPDFVVVYLGSPERYRGIDTLVEAVAIARKRLPGVRLQILSRRLDGEFGRQEARLRRMITALDLGQVVEMKSGFLPTEELIRLVGASDAVALPFRLVASGVPVSILEALAVRKPVISTKVDCIPELLEHGRGYLARPGDARDLARALVEAAAGFHASQGGGERAAPDIRGWGDAASDLAGILQAYAGSPSP